MSQRKGKRHVPPNTERIPQKIQALLPPFFAMIQLVSFLQYGQGVAS